MADHSYPPPRTVAPPVSIPEADTSPLLSSPGWLCPRCGATDWASAYPVDSGDDFGFHNLKLVPRAIKLVRLRRMLRPLHNMINLSARVCRRCGLVMLEVDPDEFAEAERKYGRR